MVLIAFGLLFYWVITTQQKSQQAAMGGGGGRRGVMPGGRGSRRSGNSEDGQHRHLSKRDRHRHTGLYDSMTAQVTGVITAVHYREGQTVTKATRSSTSIPGPMRRS